MILCMKYATGLRDLLVLENLLPPNFESRQVLAPTITFQLRDERQKLPSISFLN